MIEQLLSGFLDLVLNFVISIINLILLPFDSVIDTFFPDISNVLTYISNAFNIALNYIGWIINSIGLESFTITLLVNFLIFKLTIPLQIWVIKMAINIYNKLKP